VISGSGSDRAVSRTRLRMTSKQHQELTRHLFPPDGFEAVALMLCGRSGTPEDEVLAVHEICPIPYEEAKHRSESRVTWETDRLPALLARAMRSNLGIAKMHSHPGGFEGFSSRDDTSDRELFPGIYSWLNSERPNLSAVMLPNGSIRARVVDAGGKFSPVSSVIVVGNEIRTWSWAEHGVTMKAADQHKRTLQAFGEQTTNYLAGMSIGVVGCSGTGSWVVEMLTRLGVGELVLVDPDVVEPLNLNRIVHATLEDAIHRRPKVDVLERAIKTTGLSTKVETFAEDVHTPAIVQRLARCDAIMGCVDAIDARDLLGRLSTYYTLPYIDVGVRLVADGLGGIAHIVGTANYVHPESPSLLDRGLYSSKQLADAGLRRSDPTAYADQVRSRYISGADEGRPAVASVNAFYASLAVNELLARIHPYRDEEAPLGVTISLSQLRILLPPNRGASSGLAKHIGRGDARPLLGLPALSK
jgi:hypothetical protein